MTVAEQDWRATLGALAVPQRAAPSALNGDLQVAGTGPAPVVTCSVATTDDDARWSAVEDEALNIESGGYLVLRNSDPDRQRLPVEVQACWTGRFERLMDAGFTLHRTTRRSAAFRRASTTVLYLAPWLTFGGSDKGTVDWFRYIPRDMFRLYLLTTQPNENPLFGAAERLADEAWSLPDLMPGRAIPQFVVNFIATRNVDVVHIMNSRLGFDLLPALKAAFPHLRTVVQLHVEEEDRSGYCRFVATRYGNLIDAFSVTSEDLRDKLRRYDLSPSKLHVVYTGLDVHGEFDPDRPLEGPLPVQPREQGLNILFPARLTPQKDPLLMVAVAAALRDAGSESVIHVVGEGELRDQVEAAVVAGNLRDRVLFHGPSYDMYRWYRATDVTLLTSCFEGMPFVVFEALGMARPVVVPDLGGTREVVDGKVGFLVRRRDRVDEYVAALLELERRPELRASLGAAARRRIVERFTVEHMGTAHGHLYRRLSAQHAAAELLA